MRKISAEAFEDTSKPDGGHAVILIVGLSGLSDRPTFRLRPVDAGLAADNRGLWTGRPVTPLAIRQTERGTEFVVGPDIVDNPQLLAGTPVAIEIPEAMVRGEFLWPNVTSLAQPKRRHILLTRHQRGKDAKENAREPDKEVSVTVEQQPDRSSEPGYAWPSTGTQLVVVPAQDEDTWSEATFNGYDDAVRLRSVFGRGWSRDDVRIWLAASATLVALVIATVIQFQAMSDRADREAFEVTAAPSAAAVPPVRSAAPLPVIAEGPVNAVIAEVVRPPLMPPICDLPDISTEPLEGGRMRVRFSAPCRSGQELKLSYADVKFARQIDQSGSFDEIIDCFAGRTGSINLVFPDGKAKSLPVVANDFDRITKISVVWDAPVNIDLHVFEYAAKPGSKGHVWAKAASDAASAQEQLVLDHRGRGFMSTLQDETADGKKVEVYTLLHYNDQASGVMTVAVDNATRGELPTGAYCTGGAWAEVPFQITILDNKGQETHQAGILGAAECAKALEATTRFNDTILMPVKVGR